MIMAKAKKNAVKEYDADNFQGLDDLSYLFDEPSETAVGEMMSTIVESSRNRMNVALELTKIIVSKHSSDKVDEKEVLSIYKRSLDTVTENCILKPLLEKLV
jgi:hypothetical protein